MEILASSQLERCTNPAIHYVFKGGEKFFSHCNADVEEYIQGHY